MMLSKYHFQTFLLLFSASCWSTPFYLYQTMDASKQEYHDYDCLDFYTDGKISVFGIYIRFKDNHQIVPFCRRDHMNDQPIILSNQVPFLTFEQLNKSNISSFALYEWSAPIELAEQYQAFRESVSNHNLNISHLLFYNCSAVHRFGQYCQYDFLVNVSFT